VENEQMDQRERQAAKGFQPGNRLPEREKGARCGTGMQGRGGLVEGVWDPNEECNALDALSAPAEGGHCR